MDSGYESALWVARHMGLAGTSPLSRSEVAALGAVLRQEDLSDGARLFREGRIPPAVWVVQQGALELSSGESSRKRVIRLVYPGEAAGDAQVLAFEPSSFSAHTIGPSRCLSILAEPFRELLAGHPGIARRWLTILSRRICKAHEHLMSVLEPSLAERVARLLLAECSDGRFPFSQTTLAKMVGARRSSLNQVLRQLEEAGYVRTTYRCIEVLDRDSLSELVRDGAAAFLGASPRLSA